MANQRSEHLKKISWEHHQALRYAMHIKKGVANGVAGEVIARYIKAVNEQHLMPHFAEEEQALFSRLEHRQQENPVLRRVLEEHRALPELARKIDCDKGRNRDQMRRFAQTLVDHVKLEEKELFPWIERSLPESALQAAQAQNSDTILAIAADKAVPYDFVAKALIAAREAGVSKVGFVTEETPGN